MTAPSGNSAVIQVPSTSVSGSSPYTVNFTILFNTGIPPHTLTGWSLNCGDGNTLTGSGGTLPYYAYPSHTYTSAGVYTPILTGTFNNGPTIYTPPWTITVTVVTSYMLLPGDNGTTKTITNPIVTVTIPNDAEAPTITPGYSVIIHNGGTGTATISPDSPATITSGPTTILAGQSVVITKTGSNAWQTSAPPGGGYFNGVIMQGVRIA